MLALGGTNGAPGRLTFGKATGETVIAPRTWNHVALVREGRRASLYLNGAETPEIACEASPATVDGRLVFGGADGMAETLEGRIDEIAVFGRALKADEIARRVRLAR